MQRPLQVLLVEDNDDDEFLIQEAFAAIGAVTICDRVIDGEAALRYLTCRSVPRPAMVILDLNLPKLNGFDVLERMKRQPDLRPIPVIVLTTSDRAEDIDRSYAEGASAYINKPTSFAAYCVIAEHFAHYWTEVCVVPNHMRIGESR